MPPMPIQESPLHMTQLRSQPVTDQMVTDVAPELLRSWLKQGDTVLIDVREDVEHAEERIEGAHLHPLSRFDPEAIRAEHIDRRIIFHCRSGKRSTDAANRFRLSAEPVFHLTGGIEAWKSAGLPTLKPQSSRIPIMRQVQIVAGFLVTLGVALGLLVDQWFLAIAAFVGCGLMFAGLSGWCGMASILTKMPWNRIATTKVMR